MGLCLEPPQFITGLARVPDGTGGLAPSVRFEQYERHTAWDMPGGLANRSGAGDLDVIIYSARKRARLALAGNPTVLLVLSTGGRQAIARHPPRSRRRRRLQQAPDSTQLPHRESRLSVNAIQVGA